MVVPPAGSLTRTPPSLHRVPAERFPCFDGTTRCSDSSPCFPHRFVAFTSGTTCTPLFAPTRAECYSCGPWALVTRRPSRDV